MKKCHTLIITFARVRHLESLFALSEEFLDSRKGEEHTRQCALLVVLKQTWVSFRVIHLAFVN